MHKLPKISLLTALAVIIAAIAAPTVTVSALTSSNLALANAPVAATAAPANDPASGTGSATVTADPAEAARLQKLQQQAKTTAEQARKLAQSKADDARKKVAEAQAKAAERTKQAQADAAGKLEAAKLRLCQSRESAIDGLMGRISQRGSNNLALIDTVSERTQQFYADKQLTVDGYASLLSAVTAARTAASTAADATAGLKDSFDCTVSNPHGTATSFKELAQARNDALKDYRDAVKQLVAAVKAAAQAQIDTQTQADAADGTPAAAAQGRESQGEVQ